LKNQIQLPKKMLIGVDASEGTERAIDYGLALAEKLGSEVVFVHMVTLGDQGRTILENCEAKARKKGVRSKSFLEAGDPSVEMLRIGRDEHCDCVVIGKIGQPKIEGTLSSRTTDRIITLSEVPVICV
jgi:nucleotide-binding universal stress UspA family protein